jgi:hypothetical protein
MERLRSESVIAQVPAGTLTVTYSLVGDSVRGALYAAPQWSALGQGLQRLKESAAAGTGHGVPEDEPPFGERVSEGAKQATPVPPFEVIP